MNSLNLNYNPFKEKGISYSASLEKDESYEKFKREIDLLIKDDPFFINLNQNQRDELMGKNIIMALQGAPRNTVLKYYEESNAANKPYKWSEIDKTLNSKYKNKNENFDVSTRLLSMTVKYH
jgi:hypothetical protein